MYRQYSNDKQLLTLEEQAKQNRKGLWASDYNVPPWEWRRAQREGKQIQGKRFDEKYRCGSKRYCKEMSSCYGGWGIKYGRSGWAYNIIGNRGVQFVLQDGKRILIGSQRADELATAINTLIKP